MLEVIEDHSILSRFLGSHSRVLDLGANRGSFAGELNRRYGCAVVAVEPSDEIFQSIPKHNPKILPINVAVASKSGSVAFFVSQNPLASSIKGSAEDATRRIEVRGMSLQDLINEIEWHEGVDLVKVDIEGAEIEVFDSCSDELLRSLGQLTIEFHDFCGLISRSEVERVLSRFERLGFAHVSRFRRSYYDTWVINRQKHPISDLELTTIRLWQLVKGMGRRLRRIRNSGV